MFHLVVFQVVEVHTEFSAPATVAATDHSATHSAPITAAGCDTISAVPMRATDKRRGAISTILTIAASCDTTNVILNDSCC